MGVGAAATSIAPYTGSLDTALAAQPQRNLTTFAKNFTAAFSAMAGTEFRIATGTDRAQIAGGGESPIWVVQLACRRRPADLVHHVRRRRSGGVRPATDLQRARVEGGDADHRLHHRIGDPA